VKPFIFHIILLELGLDALLPMRDTGRELVVAFQSTVWSIIMLFILHYFFNNPGVSVHPTYSIVTRIIQHNKCSDILNLIERINKMQPCV